MPRYFDAIKKARAAEAKGTLAEIYRIEQAYLRRITVICLLAQLRMEQQLEWI